MKLAGQIDALAVGQLFAAVRFEGGFGIGNHVRGGVEGLKR
jgi:hypothetical protein